MIAFGSCLSEKGRPEWPMHLLFFLGVFITAIACNRGSESSAHHHDAEKESSKDHGHGAHGHGAPGHGAHGHGTPGHGAEADEQAGGHGHEEMEGLENNHSSNADLDSHEEEHHECVMLSAAQKKAIGLAWETAGPGSIDTDVLLRGEVVLNEDRVVHVPPRLEGVVASVHKSVGDFVKKGQLLVSIESRELAEAKASYLAARESFALAQKRNDRERELWEKQISAEQEFLEAKEAFAEARIRRDTAEYKLRALGLGPRAIENLEVGSQGNFARFQVVSPISGIVISRHASVGESVESQKSLFTVADLSSVWVDLKVFKKHIRTVVAGMDVEISAGGEGPSVQSKIDFVSPIFDKETRTATARVILKNTDSLWRPGIFVTGRVKTSSVRRAVVVHSEAVQELNGRPVVFVADEHGYKPTPVMTGLKGAKFTEILGGVKAGQKYVLQGAFELKAEIVTKSLGAHAGHGH